MLDAARGSHADSLQRMTNQPDELRGRVDCSAVEHVRPLCEGAAVLWSVRVAVLSCVSKRAWLGSGGVVVCSVALVEVVHFRLPRCDMQLRAFTRLSQLRHAAMYGLPYGSAASWSSNDASMYCPSYTIIPNSHRHGHRCCRCCCSRSIPVLTRHTVCPLNLLLSPSS